MIPKHGLVCGVIKMDTKKYQLKDLTKKNKTVGTIVSNGKDLALVNYSGCTNELLDIRHLLSSHDKFSNYGFKLKLVRA